MPRPTTLLMSAILGSAIAVPSATTAGRESRLRRAEVAEPKGKVSLSRSSDGGRTWQPRVTALDRPESDDRDPSLCQMSDGTLALFSNDCVCTSRDGGRTWSAPRPTPVFGPKGGVEDEEGRLLYGGLQRVVQADFTRIDGAAALLQADAVYRSPDKGLTWEPAGIAITTPRAATASLPGRSGSSRRYRRKEPRAGGQYTRLVVGAMHARPSDSGIPDTWRRRE